MFPTAQQLGIKEGDIMIMPNAHGPERRVMVLCTKTIHCTRNWITVKDESGRTHWTAADSLKKL